VRRDAFRRAVLRGDIALRSIHPFALAAVGLWLLSAVLWLWLVPASNDRLNVAMGEVRMLANRQRVDTFNSPDTGDRQALLGARRNLDAFNAILGDPRHLEEQLRALFAVARSLEMDLPTGQYKFSCDGASRICIWRLQFPLKGSYLQVRQFAEQSLRVISYASVDELVLRREGVRDTDIEARLGMSLYVLNPNPPALSAASPDSVTAAAEKRNAQ
jgi:hypothetical protein